LYIILLVSFAFIRRLASAIVSFAFIRRLASADKKTQPEKYLPGIRLFTKAGRFHPSSQRQQRAEPLIY